MTMLYQVMDFFCPEATYSPNLLMEGVGAVCSLRGRQQT